VLKKLHKMISYLIYLYKNRKRLYKESCQYNEMLNIMDNGKISTYFQPIVCLGTGKTLGFEILNRPWKTSIFPNVELFYDFIGKSGQVFLFEKLLRKISLKRHHNQVKKMPEFKDQLIFLNILPQVLADPSYKPGETIELLKQYHFSPDQIVLELTEKEAVADYDQFIKVIDHYKKQGFRLAVDDAGTGYNSLKTLIKLKPDFIKLDKCLIRGIHSEISQRHLVEMLLDFAEKSGVKVIAEGIETEEELFQLQQLGVHYGQGFKIGRPQPQLDYGKIPEFKKVLSIK
jgi:EAL domain-containing protein (putative c-di-GMP-specific phosphodiesterase class I)